MEKTIVILILAAALLTSGYDVIQETSIFIEGGHSFVNLPLPYLLFGLCVYLLVNNQNKEVSQDG